MPEKRGAKGKKAAKVKDLPARSLKGKDSADVKGGMNKSELIQMLSNRTKMAK